MWKRVLMSAPLLLGALMLAACGGNGDNGDDAGAVQEENRPVPEGAREVEVAASLFDFSPEEITVGVGEDVAIVLESEDVLHDFVVDDVGDVVERNGERNRARRPAFRRAGRVRVLVLDLGSSQRRDGRHHHRAVASRGGRPPGDGRPPRDAT
jgi:hypothetical protein